MRIVIDTNIFCEDYYLRGSNFRVILDGLNSLPGMLMIPEVVVDEVVKNAGSALERDAAIALRRIEHAAKMMVTVRPDTNEFQQLLARVLTPEPGAEQPSDAPSPPASSLIIP